MRDGRETKERITRAALTLFVEKGFAETSIRDITSAVGVTEGALYRHFASKEQLAWDLFSTNYISFATELTRARIGRTGFGAQIGAMLDTFCRFFDEDPELFSYLLLVQHNESGKLPDTIKTPVDAVRECVIDAMESGDIPPADPEFVTASLLGVVLQVATARIYGKIDKGLCELKDELTATCLRVAQG